ncbi:hypothetical protein CYMTET_7773 [Cymbomonas tetramitiformis]|uniref:Uncharacterized protein n=1 Tax=Cymbomonas tetramitiformis TaxID=36881 RepID=A0AAE0KQD8_9CHLO|nr:hypothetical protein CYMTET_34262 [Cymbomonas tetramitiformis]KAK3284585.1 hypothetical protein CYMTET_7773 [Cymbomonas tetramitiformis]
MGQVATGREAGGASSPIPPGFSNIQEKPAVMTPEDTVAIIISQREQAQSLMSMARTLCEDRARETLERKELQQRIEDMSNCGASVPRISP